MKRKPIPKAVQVSIFQRDRWLCRWCGYPVVFAPAMKYLEQLLKEDGLLRTEGFKAPLAYHDAHWTRRGAPLLDHMGAVIDHVEAHSGGGSADESNLVTACNKCNARKSNAPADVFSRRSPLRLVKGSHGEPEYWDGLSTLFIMRLEWALAKETKGAIRVPKSEREWLQALKSSVPISK